MKKFFAVLLMLVPISAFAASNDFVGPIENACKTSPSFDNFLRALCKITSDKKGGMVCAAGNIVAPDFIRASLGNIHVATRSDHSLITVPAIPGRLTWGGMSIIGFEHWAGHQNGINGFALRLDAASVAAAKASLKKAGLRLRHAQDEVSLEKIGVQIVKGDDRVIRAMCDFSN